MAAHELEEPATREPLTADAITEATKRLIPEVEAAREENEKLLTIRPDLVDALRAAGVFSMTQPRSWGGPELDPATQFDILELLATADGSTGWCVYIGSSAGYWSAFLDQDVARAMYPRLDLVTGGSVFPTAKAIRRPDGFEVTGRWSFGSGCLHSAWMVSGCMVYDGDVQSIQPDGRPQTVICFLPQADFEVIENWNTTGLRGTGSHDYSASGVFVPAERTFNLASSAIRRPGPLYAFRRMVFFNHSAVALGIARAAIDAFLELARVKRTAAGGLLEAEDHARVAVARAEALVGSARSYCLSVLSQFWAELEAGREPSPALRARYRLAIWNAHNAGLEAVGHVFHAAGTAAIRAPGMLDRCHRDLLTANQHMVASSNVLRSAGAFIFGTDPGDPTF
jgi:alkylation response protein AidB-like acyl-CoA dehydrogenase